MRFTLTGRTVAIGIVLLLGILATPGVMARQGGSDMPARLVVTSSMGQHISIVDTVNFDYQQFEVGPAPWGIALTGDGRAFISNATGVAVFDLASESVVANVPYLADLGPVAYGEYREGGMGIVASPDGRFVYVGVHITNAAGWLEALDTDRPEMVGRVQVGIRPFDVVISPDGATVYSIDHDSFTVTVVSASDLTTYSIDVAPLGYGGFDKPHYAKVLGDGTILLPYQGQVLLHLDPATGEQTTLPLSANTHMHGIATSSDDTCAAIVGTGPVGGATGPASLTLLDL